MKTAAMSNQILSFIIISSGYEIIHA